MTLAALAQDYADAILATARREYPNASHHVATSAADRPTNRELHPAFYGCFDWHSAVHMHDALVLLLARVPDAFDAAAARALLDEHLTPANLAAEAAYVRAHPGWERPYGWGWALTLAEDARALAATDRRAEPWAAALAPLAHAVRDNLVAWLPRATYPLRVGMHPNSAFGLLLALPHARARAAAGDPALMAVIDAAARRWFAEDRAYPLAWEPQGADFLSPALTEAALMAAILGPAFPAWFATFLPGAGLDLGPLAEPAAVADLADGQTAHLAGLNLSRAWLAREVAAALPADHPAAPLLRAAADANAAASLDAVTGSDYMAEHWLVSYALRALPAA